MNKKFHPRFSCGIAGTPSKENLPTRQLKVLPHFFINVTLLRGAKRLKMYRTRERERKSEWGEAPTFNRA
jgi:hypothetical protein